MSDDAEYAKGSIQTCIDNIKREDTNRQILTAINNGFIEFSIAETSSSGAMMHSEVVDLFTLIHTKLRIVESNKSDLTPEEEDDLIYSQNVLEQMCLIHEILLEPINCNQATARRLRPSSAPAELTTKS